MAFIAAPALNIRLIEWALDRPAQINVSLSGKRTVSSTILYGKWSARVELAPIVGQANAQAIRSFIARCNGPLNRFRLYATESAQNANSGVTVSAAATAGDTALTITGYTGALLAGQMATINGQLVQITADQSAGTITFEPPLRADASVGTTVVTSRPYALVRMADSTAGWSVGPGQVYEIAFDVEEAVGESDGVVPESGA